MDYNFQIASKQYQTNLLCNLDYNYRL